MYLNLVPLSIADCWILELHAEKAEFTTGIHPREDHLTTVIDVIVTATRVDVGLFPVLNGRTAIGSCHGLG